MSKETPEDKIISAVLRWNDSKESDCPEDLDVLRHNVRRELRRGDAVETDDLTVAYMCGFSKAETDAQAALAAERERCALVAIEEHDGAMECSKAHRALGNLDLAKRWELRARSCAAIALTIRQGNEQ